MSANITNLVKIEPCDHINNMVSEHLQVVEEFFRENTSKLENFAYAVSSALENGKKILICGNGGSAADAQHIAAEFVGRFVENRRALPAIALTTDTSILTAVGNDYGYEDVFSRQIEALGGAGDVLIAISTSGSSPNILKAITAGKNKNMQIATLLGKDGGKASEEGDFNFIVKHVSTARIQECHIMLLHILCLLVENKMGFNN